MIEDVLAASGDVQLVQARGVTVVRDGAIVLPPIDLDLAPGETLAVMGPSGSGKTTLLNCITGLVAATGGSLICDGLDMVVSSPAARARARRDRIGLMFQDPELLPELSLVENVAVTAIFDGTPRKSALQHAAGLLDQVGLGGRANDRVDQISRGEAQRVALARALARQDMALLVADEPTASLDAHTGRQVIDLTLECIGRTGASAVIATHDPGVAERCHAVLVLGAGVGQ